MDNNIFDLNENDKHWVLQNIVNDAFFCDPKNEKDVVCLIHTLIAVLGDKRKISRNDAFSLISQLWYKNNEKIIIEYPEVKNEQ